VRAAAFIASRHSPLPPPPHPSHPAARSLERIGLLRGDRVPVDDVPPRADLGRALVLLLELVRVLPDVEAEDGRLPCLHRGRVLVRRRDDLERRRRHRLVDDEPRPAAAEDGRGRVREILLELVEGAEGVRNRVAERAGGRAAAARRGRRHPLREEAVVVHLPAARVADDAADDRGDLERGVGGERSGGKIRARGRGWRGSEGE
jgi:hypothetical protein